MMRGKGWRRYALVVWLGLFFLVGCATQPNAQPIPTRMAVALLRPSSTPPSLLPPTFTLIPTPTPTFTPLPTATPTLTPTPTPTPTPTLFPYATLDGTLPTPETAVPTPVPTFAIPDSLTLIALLGNDGDSLTGQRTDSIILVAVDQEAQTATMLSLPRDLYLAVPGWQMSRINGVLPHGNVIDYPDTGKGLLRDTLLWNFGLPIDHYVRIGFAGFKQVVDVLGGVETAVTCPLRDWRLKSPNLDPAIEDNWEQFTLESGLQQMDGDLALWYARSRRTTNDFERGRRQQQVLQAIFDQAMSQNRLSQLPELWDAYQQMVQTDLTLGTLLELAALAPAVRENGVRHLTLPYAAFRSWQVPSSKAAVQLIQWEAAAPVFAQLLQPSDLQRGGRPLTIEIVTNSYTQYRLAAENLAWFGLLPVFTYTAETDPSTTNISLHAPNTKGTAVALVAWAFNQSPDTVTVLGDTDYPYTYTIRLGTNFNSCRPLLEAPRGS